MIVLSSADTGTKTNRTNRLHMTKHRSVCFPEIHLEHNVFSISWKANFIFVCRITFASHLFRAELKLASIRIIAVSPTSFVVMVSLLKIYVLSLQPYSNDLLLSREYFSKLSRKQNINYVPKVILFLTQVFI